MIYSCNSSMNNEFQGKEVVGSYFNFTCDSAYIGGHHVKDYIDTTSNYTIISFVDQSGCTPCQLHLSRWKKVMSKLNQDVNKTVSLILVIDESMTDIVINEVMKEDFKDMIVIEHNGNIRRLLNTTRTDGSFSFLLNQDKKIVAYGDPCTDSHILKLYMHTIGVKNLNEVTPKIKLINPVKSAGIINDKKVHKENFYIDNKDTLSYFIEKVLFDSIITRINYNQSEIAPGKHLRIEVCFSVDNVKGPFRSTASVKLDKVAEPMTLIVKGYSL